MKKTLFIVIALFMSTALLGGCGSGTAGTTPVVTETAAPPTTVPTPVPSVLRVGILEDIPCWNPYACFSNIESNSLTYGGIADFGPEPGSNPVPGLANSWDVSADGLTWTIHFDKGITFSDGTPFTAQTFVDEIKWIQSTSLNYWYPETLNMTSIEAVDDYTVKYTTKSPILNSPDYNFIWIFVVPPTYYKLDDTTLWSFTDDKPIGAGPYIMTKHVPGQYIVWDANPTYHRGKPPIDQMIWQIYSNESAEINALLAGEIDATYIGVSPQYVKTLTAASNITVEERQGGIQLDMYFNMSAKGTENPALNDPLVRQAIDYAIDKQAIVNVAYLGHGIVCPTNWACGPMFKGEINPDLVATPFDIAKANTILDQAGYTNKNSDGIREMPDGTPLSFKLITEIEHPEEVTVADSLKGWLAQIGIGLTTESLDHATWLSVTGNRTYDIALGYQKPDVDPGSIDWYFSCWAADAGTSGANISGYCNPQMDTLEQQYWYSSDLTGRWTPMFAAQKIINQDRPFIILAAENEIQAYRNDRFTFPTNTSHWNGIISTYGLMNAVVVKP